MNWNVQDIQLYEQSKEYIDTAIIPLIPIGLQDATSIVQKGEFLSQLSETLEREYRGRVLQLPPFTYIMGQKLAEEQRLREWDTMLQEAGFRYIMYVTSDHEWKQHDLSGTTFWAPALPLHQLDEQARRNVLQATVSEISAVLMEMWKNEE